MDTTAGLEQQVLRLDLDHAFLVRERRHVATTGRLNAQGA
jgi:hypothetical protein